MTSASKSSVSFSSLAQRSQPPTIARLMTMALESPKLLSLAAGFTDNTTLPVEIVRAATDALARPGHDPEFLQYGTNQGRIGLRKLLAKRLAVAEPTLDADYLGSQMLVTNGSQQALYLAIQALCDPGDIVLVDRPSYFVFLEMLTGLGVQARSIPVGADGRVDAAAFGQVLNRMERSGETKRLKAVYLIGYFSNPSGRSLDEAEKNAVAQALSERGLRVPVLEDAAYRDLYFTRPCEARSVLSLSAWDEFPKLYFSTLTKSFATGLKVGYAVCTDAALLNKMLHVKGHHDFGTANFSQAVLERVIQSGDFDAQLRRIRPAYQEKMRSLHGALVAHGLAERGWRWSEPTGGLYLWLQAPEGMQTGMDSAFCQACIRAGVLYVPGELCFGDDAPYNFARLSFGVLAPAELAEAARRFVEVAREVA